MNKIKITGAMVKAASDVMPSLKAESVRAMLEAAIGLVELPKPSKTVEKVVQKKRGKVPGAVKHDNLSLLTIIPRLKDGAEVIVPIMPGQNAKRMQPNLKTLEIRNPLCPGLKIKTENILFFSPNSPEQMFRGVRCVISRPEINPRVDE